MAKRSKRTDNASRVVLVVDSRTVEMTLVGADGTERDSERFKLADDAEDIDHEKATRDVFDLLYQVALKGAAE